MPRMKIDEDFDRMCRFLEDTRSFDKYVIDKRASEVYNFYINNFDGHLSQRAFSVRFSKRYRDLLECKMTGNERRWKLR